MTLLSVRETLVPPVRLTETEPSDCDDWNAISLGLKVEALTVSEKESVTLLVVKSRSNPVRLGLLRSDSKSEIERASESSIAVLVIPARSKAKLEVADKKVFDSCVAKLVMALISLRSVAVSCTIMIVSVIAVTSLSESVTLTVESFFVLCIVISAVLMVEALTVSLKVKYSNSAVRSISNEVRDGGKKSAVILRAFTASSGLISSIELPDISVIPS